MVYVLEHIDAHIDIQSFILTNVRSLTSHQRRHALQTAEKTAYNASELHDGHGGLPIPRHNYKMLLANS